MASWWSASAWATRRRSPALVGRYHAQLLRLAETFVPSRAVAEEVVQDTWLGAVPRHRPLRGPVVAEDVAVPHPGQPGAHDG